MSKNAHRPRRWMQLDGSSAGEILGGIDAVKLRPSMTLFAHAAPGEPPFRRALDRYFDGSADEATEQLLQAQTTPAPRREATWPHPNPTTPRTARRSFWLS
jgi:hypothetical protein